MGAKAIVLAAGQGTRMRSTRAKVLHDILGRPLVGWALGALSGCGGGGEVVVVIGHQADQVAAALPEGVRTALQAEQLGTGHAARVGLTALEPEPGDTVVVVPGDSPLLRPETIDTLVATHEASGAAATLLTVVADNPTGYGRILRDGDAVVGIVEEGDADDTQRAIREVGTSVYAFTAGLLGPALDALGTGNAQGEYYLTDVAGWLAGEGNLVGAVQAAAVEGLGVNSQAQLAEAAAHLRRRINLHWMDQGVWMADPDRVSIGPDVTLGPDVRLHPEVHLEGAVTVAEGAEIGPSVYAADTTIGAGARVWYSVVRHADIGAAAEVGPYVSLRPGAVLLERSKAGTFVEIKGSVVGPGSKVPHLSYVGDADIGAGSNIGAGTIFANYDGYAKHRTVIGDGVKVGANTTLVAPVSLGDEAWTGAGTVVTGDVNDGALAVGRASTKEIPGYAARRRARAERDET